MKTSFLLISHSKEITDGIKKMIEQMQTSDDVSIYSLGGTTEDEIGSDPTKIVDAVNEASKEDTSWFLLISVVQFSTLKWQKIC